MAEVSDFYPSALRAKYHLDDFPVAQRPLSKISSANIGWVPDLDQFKERRAARLKNEALETEVPRRWPQVMHGPLVWRGSDMQAQSQYIYNLSPSDTAEIEAALSRMKNSGLDLENINQFTFPLPKLGPALEDLTHQVHEGCGFAVLRGLQPWTYSKEENIIIYLGLSSYIGERRGRQNLAGSKLTHIADVKSAGVSLSERRPIFSNLAQPFHADLFCDILALYYLNHAKTGGETSLASSWKVYNELAASRPDVIHTLAENNWTHDTYGCNPPFYQQPLLYNHDGKIILNFSRRILTGAPMTPRSTDIPPLTETQAEALDALHFCAQEHSLKLNSKKGDMLFINNLAVMHSRSPFEDDEENSRYALRLWLSNPDKAWKIPPTLQLDWDRTFAPLEGIKDHYETEPFADKDKVRTMVKADDPGSGSTRCG